MNTYSAGASNALTSRQARILSFIRRYVAEHGYSPTIRELSDACDIPSTSNVNYILDQLQELGLLKRTPGSPRTIVLTLIGQAKLETTT